MTSTKPLQVGPQQGVGGTPLSTQDQSHHWKYNLSIQLNLSKTVVDKDKLAFRFEYKERRVLQQHTERGQEELSHVRGQEQKSGGPHAQGWWPRAATLPEARGSSQEE